MYVKTAVQLIDLLMVAVMHFWGMRSFFVVARIIKECRITMHNIKDKKKITACISTLSKTLKNNKIDIVMAPSVKYYDRYDSEAIETISNIFDFLWENLWRYVTSKNSCGDLWACFFIIHELLPALYINQQSLQIKDIQVAKSNANNLLDTYNLSQLNPFRRNKAENDENPKQKTDGK
ncbi:MAG: hypothetical protein ILO53_08930 [Clostridia bacterium]|nr:hypothetical protein [Clostridia bacterium]